MLHIQDFVHAFQAEATLAIEEVGDVGLLESGLLREAKSRQLAFFNAIPQGLTQIFLQCLEFHAKSIARVYSIMLSVIQP
jgi:hypothetical protein